MKYKVELKPKAIKDIKGLHKSDQKRIVNKIESLTDNLYGNVKKLTNFTPEYRLRVGNWRVLFEVENDLIVIYRVLPRKEAYRR